MTEPETTPVTPADLRDVLRTMATWQHDGSPVPLHPGDVGWHHRFGADAVTGSLRTWAVDGRIVALALVDEPQLWRLSLDPAYVDDEGLARRVLAAFPDGPFALECRSAGALTGLLAAAGWEPDEPWTPLVRDLSAPVEAPAMDVAVAGPAHVEDRVAVQRAAFTGSTFSVERWHAMAAGPAYADARCLVGYAAGTPVAAATVWSAGPGRPGLLEPLGVHAEHRGAGHGRAISLAAAATLRELGASSAVVCTPASNTGAVATYVSAGFTALPDVRDLRRPSTG